MLHEVKRTTEIRAQRLLFSIFILAFCTFGLIDRAVLVMCFSMVACLYMWYKHTGKKVPINLLYYLYSLTIAGPVFFWKGFFYRAIQVSNALCKCLGAYCTETNMWQTVSQLDQQIIRKSCKAIGLIKTLSQQDIWPQYIFQMLKKIWGVKIMILSEPAEPVTFPNPAPVFASRGFAGSDTGRCPPSLKWPIIFSPVWLWNWHWKWDFFT